MNACLPFEWFEDNGLTELDNDGITVVSMLIKGECFLMYRDGRILKESDLK